MRLAPVLALATLAIAHSPRVLAQRPETLAISNVTVIDVESGRRLPAYTVVVRGERIAAVGPVGKVSIPRGARVVDGRGKFLIPGLWDTHVHVGDQRATKFALFLSYGVTAARDLHFGEAANPTIGAVALRDSLNAGLVIGPRYIVGTQVAAPGSGAPTAYIASTPEEGRAMVRRLKSERADLVKAYGPLTMDTYAAIMDEARKLGLPVDGHVSNRVGVRAASLAGQRTIEHVAESGVLFGCTKGDTTWGAEIRRARAHGDSVRSQVVWGILRRASTSYDEASCRNLARYLAHNGTAFTPTLHISRDVYTAFDAPPMSATERELLAPSQRRWLDSMLVAARELSDKEAWRAHVRREREIVRVMQEGGVLVLAGTDLAPWGFPVAGMSLHEELAMLVDAGLTPLQALRAATINPARAFRMTDSLGTVSPHKLGDLVLLDADPLLDIGNARRISGVLTRGRWLDRPALDSMLADVRTRLAATP
jgi:imidazolonepropionase-like amidohydrolase